MAALSTVIAGIGVAAGLAGTAMQVAGANAQAKASIRAEQLREKQLNIESSRQRRAAIRNALAARAQSLVTATAQGASTGSGFMGAQGQISQRANENVTGVNLGQEIGAGIFKSNRDSYAASSLVSFGGGLSSLGGALIDNAPTIGRIATYAAGKATG